MGEGRARVGDTERERERLEGIFQRVIRVITSVMWQTYFRGDTE